ncbi:MAG: DUF4105 domain-containing protein [bacterium]
MPRSKSRFLFPFLCTLIILCVIGGTFEATATSPDYLEYLIDLAEQKKLYEDRYWHILLHYEKGAFSTASTVDDPQFFLSPDGKHDPRAELEASIRTFFSDEVKEGDFPVCQFIARYTWLKEELGIDPTKVPLFECDAVTAVHPKSAILVFPTYYMNNPASMFGHTLLNIESEYPNKLLTKSVNYSAHSEETNGILFAVKGLFGFYKGYYSVLPYYMKIQQYSDISQRDIWEYHLNLTVPELERMVRHIRELENIYSDYYFFDENCSYSLLYLLEAARPSAHLTDKFSVWALPIDTIREVKKSGMIEKVEFRPSKASKINHTISLLHKSAQEIALEITEGIREPSSVLDLDMGKKEKILILDLVIDYVGYKYAKKKISKEQYQKIYLHSLKARSTLGKLEESSVPPEPPQPDRGRDSRRVDAALGINHGESFFELGIRPVFSDLLDTDYGYHQGVQIKFLETRFRYYFSEEKLVLDSFGGIDIVSLSPRGRFFKPLSWKVSTGVYRLMMANKKESPVFRLNTGGGLAYYNKIMGLCYVVMEPEFQYSPRYEKDFSLGGGFSVGTRVDVTRWWKCHLHARQIYYEWGDEHESGTLSLSQNLVITTNNQIRLDIAREKIFDEYNTEAHIAWCRFF